MFQVGAGKSRVWSPTLSAPWCPPPQRTRPSAGCREPPRWRGPAPAVGLPGDVRSCRVEALTCLAACREETACLVACPKEPKSYFPLLFTGPCRLGSTSVSDRLAASRNDRHPRLSSVWRRAATGVRAQSRLPANLAPNAPGYEHPRRSPLDPHTRRRACSGASLSTISAWKLAHSQ